MFVDEGTSHITGAKSAGGGCVVLDSGYVTRSHQSYLREQQQGEGQQDEGQDGVAIDINAAGLAAVSVSLVQPVAQDVVEQGEGPIAPPPVAFTAPHIETDVIPFVAPCPEEGPPAVDPALLDDDFIGEEVVEQVKDPFEGSALAFSGHYYARVQVAPTPATSIAPHSELEIREPTSVVPFVAPYPEHVYNFVPE